MIQDWTAERSKAPVSGTGLFGGVGSNPTPIMHMFFFFSFFPNSPTTLRPCNQKRRPGGALSGLDGRAVQGASLRHWSLRRRGFESHSNHTFRVSLVGQDRWLSPTRPGFDSRTRKFSFCSCVCLFFFPPERVLALAPRDAISSGSSVGRAWV